MARVRTDLPIKGNQARHVWRFWLGLAISVVFLALAIRQADWNRTVTTLAQADLLWIGLGIGLLLITFVVFAFRWQVLLSSTARFPVQDMFAYIMIGYLANTVLPLRLGDVARATLISKRHTISASLVLGSIVLERVLDVLTVLLLALGLSLVVDFPPIIRTSMLTFAGGALAVLFSLVVLALNGDRLPALVARLPWAHLRRLAERLTGLVARFAGGLRTLRNVRQLALELLLSGLAWSVAGLGTVCWVRAFHLPVPWYAGLFVLVVVNLGSAIPSSPGFVGVYHYLVVLALSVWLPDKSTALGYAIATHGLNMAVNVLLGGVCLWREEIGLVGLGQSSGMAEE